VFPERRREQWSGSGHGRGPQSIGLIVVEPDDFVGIHKRQPGALVVHATGGFFSTKYKYLTGDKGLAFFTKAPAPLDMPPGTKLMQAKSIWVPGG
jgi:hypothetical protein